MLRPAVAFGVLYILGLNAVSAAPGILAPVPSIDRNTLKKTCTLKGQSWECEMFEACGLVVGNCIIGVKAEKKDSAAPKKSKITFPKTCTLGGQTWECQMFEACGLVVGNCIIGVKAEQKSQESLACHVTSQDINGNLVCTLPNGDSWTCLGDYGVCGCQHGVCNADLVNPPKPQEPLSCHVTSQDINGNLVCTLPNGDSWTCMGDYGTCGCQHGVCNADIVSQPKAPKLPMPKVTNFAGSCEACARVGNSQCCRNHKTYLIWCCPSQCACGEEFSTCNYDGC